MPHPQVCRNDSSVSTTPEDHNTSFSGVTQLEFLTNMPNLNTLDLYVNISCRDYALDRLGQLLECVNNLKSLKLDLVTPVQRFNAKILVPCLSELDEIDEIWYCLVHEGATQSLEDAQQEVLAQNWKHMQKMNRI